MKNKLYILTAVIFFSVALPFYLYYAVTDIEKPFPEIRQKTSAKTFSDTVKIGVVSRFSPLKIYEGYQPIMDYLTKQTGILFELKLGSSYKETVSQLDNGDVAAAFLGSYIFAKENNSNLKAVLKPLNKNGAPYFRSALIVRKNSVLYRVEDLVGKKIAVPSEESFSGNWFQNFVLKKYGLKKKDFKEIKHFPFHNSVVKQLLMENYAAGVVKDRVAKEYSGKGIRIILYSEPVPGSPLVISDKSDKKTVELLVKTLLKVNSKEIRNWDREFAYGFVRAKNTDYDELRKLISGIK